MSQWKREGFQENVALYCCEDVVALKNDRNSSLMKFTLIWNIGIRSICLDPVSVICSVNIELGKTTFFLLVCMYTEMT